MRALLCALPLVCLAVPPAVADDATAPLVGRDRIAAARPDWCGDAEPTGDMDLRAVERELDAHGLSAAGLSALARLACDRPDDRDVQRLVATWRQRHVDLTGLSAADERAELRLRVTPDGFAAQVASFCQADAPGDEASPEARTLAEARAAAAGCGDETALAIRASSDASTLGWWLDRGATPPSEVARAVYVLRCLRRLDHDGTELSWPDARDPHTIAAFAMCGPDARRLDPRALEAELARPPWNDATRANARATFALARATAASLTTALTAPARRDPAYQRLLFDAPEAGWRAWETTAAANRAALEKAWRVEQAFYGPSRRARPACADGLRAAFAAHVASGKPTTVEDAQARAVDSVGYVLLSALALCDAEEGRALAAREEVELLRPATTPFRRGPRLAAYDAILAALSDILADRTRFPLAPDVFVPVVSPPMEQTMLEATFDGIANATTYDEPDRGTIAALTPGADGVRVTFQAVKTRVWQRRCTSTGQISMITSDGTVLYHQRCVTEGTITVDVTPRPLTVPTALAAGLRVGQVATFAIDQADGAHRRGIPVEAWTGTRLAVYLGVAL